MPGAEPEQREVASGPRLVWAALAMTLSLTGRAGAESVEVHSTAGRVAITATAAPLSLVLDRLAAAVGMELEYEEAPPRQLITLELADRTPAEAVLSVLEGQGLDYALQLDPEGTGARSLFIASGRSSSPRRPPAPARAPSRRPRPVPAAPANLEDLYQDDDEEPELDPDVEPDEAVEPGQPAQTPAPRPFPFPTPIPPLTGPGSPLIFPGPLALPTPDPTPQQQG